MILTGKLKDRTKAEIATAALLLIIWLMTSGFCLFFSGAIVEALCQTGMPGR